jgi:hypothetical protein
MRGKGLSSGRCHPDVVILSAAKDLDGGDEILHFVQDDDRPGLADVT